MVWVGVVVGLWVMGIVWQSGVESGLCRVVPGRREAGGGVVVEVGMLSVWSVKKS